MSHWSSRLPVCFPSQRTPVQNLYGDLCETGIFLLALSRYIGDPNVIDHCGRLSWASSRIITKPLSWSHIAFLSQFHARCRFPFRLHNRRSRLLRGSPVESLQSHFILIMSHWSSELPVCIVSLHCQPSEKYTNEVNNLKLSSTSDDTRTLTCLTET